MNELKGGLNLEEKHPDTADFNGRGAERIRKIASEIQRQSAGRIADTELIEESHNVLQNRRVARWQGKLLVLHDLLIKNPKNEDALSSYREIYEKISQTIPPETLQRELSPIINEIEGVISEDPGNKS